MAKFRLKEPMEVEAIKLMASIPGYAEKGQWLITDGDGSQTVMDEEDFLDRFEEIKMQQEPSYVQGFGHQIPDVKSVRVTGPIERAGLPDGYNPREGLMF